MAWATPMKDLSHEDRHGRAALCLPPSLESCRLLSWLAALAACEREKRDFHTPPPANPPGDHYQRDAYDVAQGKQLFSWMNCVGCHAHGGGGIGPALMDAQWIYGGKHPADLFAPSATAAATACRPGSTG